MSPADLLASLRGQGLHLACDAGDGSIRVRPAHRMTERDRALICAHKAALLAILVEEPPRELALLEAAIHKLCDRRGDSDDNRRALLEDAQATPAHLHADLLAYVMEQASQAWPKTASADPGGRDPSGIDRARTGWRQMP